MRKTTSPTSDPQPVPLVSEIHAEDVERVKAWDKALKGAKNTLEDLSLAAGELLGTKSGFFTHEARGLELLGPLLRGDMKGLDAKLFRYGREDYNIEHANRVAMEKAGVDRSTARGLEEQYDSGRLTREEYNEAASREIDKLQINAARIEQDTENRDKLNDAIRKLEMESLGLAEDEAEVRRAKFAGDVLAAGVQGGFYEGNAYGDVEKWMRWYDDRISERNAQKQGASMLKEEERLQEQAGDEAVRREEERFRRETEIKKRLRSPEETARASLRELYEFRDSLSPKAFQRGRGEIAEQLMGSMGGGGFHPVGMMAAGSAELHALVAKMSMPDAKEVLMRQAIELLRSIERELLQERGEVLN
jgi:hypothetical protein